MLAGELAASERRLKERTKAELEKARAKLEKERILAERQRARQESREVEARRRRLEQLKFEEEQREAREQELEANNGVLWRGKLQAVPAPEDAAASKGIKRAADKVLLPPSAGTSLLDQAAMKNGAYFFELKHPSGRHTHAGILDFTSAEGFIAVPRKVARCLWGPDADIATCEGPLEVAYKRLPKATRAVFQPRSAEFQKAVGDGLREALEAALLQHSALTVGDWIEVHHAGQIYDLRVRELAPADAVSVIDTEVEAEVHPSVETEERILAEEMEAQRRLAEAAAAAAAAMEAEEVAAAEAAAEAARRKAIQDAKAAALPEEPSADVPAVACLFRFPDGSRHSRRFALTQPISHLFDFVDSKGGSGNLPGQYHLVTQYPRQVFTPLEVLVGETPLAGDGGGPSRQVLFLEPISGK